MRKVHLDSNATTRVDPAVLEAMMPFLTECFGNPSSMHDAGSVAAAALRTARERVQVLLGAAQDQEIIWTSGGTEADNTAILSALEAQPGRDEIVTSAVEHAGILALCGWLEKSRRVKVHYIPVDPRGRLDIAAYGRALGPRTAIASIMWANNETGTVFPVARLAEMAREAGALFHTDAVQAVGRVPIVLKATAIDMLSLSGHKLHAPKGVGALYVRKGVKLRPLLRGGSQERGRRAGTENVPGIVALGRAAELAAARMEGDATRLGALRDRFEQGVRARIPAVVVHGDLDRRLANTSSIGFEHVEGDALLSLLNRAGIAVSAGSACSAGAMEPSHVLRAMKLRPSLAHGTLRFSLSRDNDDADIDAVLETLPGIVARLRAQSPFWLRDGAPFRQFATSDV